MSIDDPQDQYYMSPEDAEYSAAISQAYKDTFENPDNPADLIKNRAKIAYARHATYYLNAIVDGRFQLSFDPNEDPEDITKAKLSNELSQIIFGAARISTKQIPNIPIFSKGYRSNGEEFLAHAKSFFLETFDISDLPQVDLDLILKLLDLNLSKSELSKAREIILKLHPDSLETPIPKGTPGRIISFTRYKLLHDYTRAMTEKLKFAS